MFQLCSATLAVLIAALVAVLWTSAPDKTVSETAVVVALLAGLVGVNLIGVRAWRGVGRTNGSRISGLEDLKT